MRKKGGARLLAGTYPSTPTIYNVQLYDVPLKRASITCSSMTIYTCSFVRLPHGSSPNVNISQSTTPMLYTSLFSEYRLCRIASTGVHRTGKFPVCREGIILGYNLDPDLVTSSGERVLVTKSGWPLNRGQIPLISYIGGSLSCH
eukprot:sb/3473972/